MANHMSFGGPPVKTETAEEADELMRVDEKASEVEAEVLSAPPKLVYSKLILRFTRKLLVAVADKWDSHVLVMDKVAPQNWKTAVVSLGGDERHLVAMRSRRNDLFPCFWGFIDALGLYESCLVMLNLRCLGIIFEDETARVA
ncbi:putative protein-serine/threonine phosphatase [Helianthus annuus]|nr:putative protein-serine/threonine phosphatase [Helianthus annuus]